MAVVWWGVAGGGGVDELLKPRPDGLFGVVVGTAHGEASGSARDGTGCVCLTPLNWTK